LALILRKVVDREAAPCYNTLTEANNMERNMEKQVIKTYSGKAGKCMCGCAGKWNYTAYGAEHHSPGYKVDASERGAKIITAKVLKHPKVQNDGDCYFVEEGDRILAVYFG
jgi:hypothetical protein